MRISPYLTLLLTISLVHFAKAVINDPNLNIAIDQDTLKNIQTNILAPLLKEKGEFISIDSNYSFRAASVFLDLTNISISNLTLDWETTQLITSDDEQNPIINIKGLNMSLSFHSDFCVLFCIFEVVQNLTVNIIDLDLSIALGFEVTEENQTYAFLKSVNATYKELTFSSIFMELLYELVNLFGKTLDHLISFSIADNLLSFNSTIKSGSVSGLNVQINDRVNLTASLANPITILDVADSKTVVVASLNLSLINLRGPDYIPIGPYAPMPSYSSEGLGMQFHIGEGLISQALWMIFSCGLVKKELSDLDVPSFSPIGLNTTDLQIIFPNISQDFGADKGVYMRFRAGGDFPLFAINDGRLMVKTPLYLELHVDSNGTNYPDEGVDDCENLGHCKQAMALNVTAFTGLLLFPFNKTALGAHLMDLEIIQIDVLDGDVDPIKITKFLNQMFVSLILDINIELNKGIYNKYIGLFGMSAAEVVTGAGYLKTGLSFEEE